MIALLRQRNFRLLWLSQLISMLGYWAMFAALPFFVYQVTGSVAATGIMFIVEVLPSVLLGTIAGVFVDRWDRKWTMIWATILRGIALLPLTLFHKPEDIWIVYLVAFSQTLINQFFGPANNALLPRLVKKEELLIANSLDSFGENMARIAGPAIGGTMLAAFSLGGVVMVNAIAFLLAALFIFGIQEMQSPDQKNKKKEAPSARAEWLNFWKEWLGGLKLVGERPVLRFAFLAVGIALIGDAILSVLYVVFAQNILGVGPVEFGWVLTGRGLGGLLGGLIIARIGPRFSSRALFSWGLIGTGLVLFLMVLPRDFNMLLIGSVLLGLPVMAWLISGQTWLQERTPDQYRGRVFGAFESTGAIMGLLGMAFATLFGESFGIVPSLSLAATLFALAGLLALIWLRGIKDLA